MHIVWTKAARRDANAIFEYLVERNPRAAETTAATILKAVEKLADHPRLGRQGQVDNTREFVIKRYPYIVIYAIKETRVTILRIRHTAQQWPEESDDGDSAASTLLNVSPSPRPPSSRTKAARRCVHSWQRAVS